MNHSKKLLTTPSITQKSFRLAFIAEPQRFGYSHRKGGFMYYSSYQPLAQQTACLAIRASSLRVPSTEVLLSAVKREDCVRVTLSTDAMVSQATFGATALPHHKHPSVDFFQASGIVSNNAILDLSRTFDEAVRLINQMHRDREIDHEDFIEHLEMLNHYNDGLDVEGLETYLHLSNLSVIAQQCKAYRVPEYVTDLWLACWGAVLKLANSMK